MAPHDGKYPTSYLMAIVMFDGYQKRNWFLLLWMKLNLGKNRIIYLKLLIIIYNVA